MILITGGAGYIGSHTCVTLLQAGYSIVVVDNLSNSHETALQRVQTLTGKTFPFIQGDIRYPQIVDQAFAFPIQAVIHFAGLKAVGESVLQPVRYYDNNVNGSLQLLKAMRRHQVKTLVFSSSATVYGNPTTVPISENFPLSATQPYGRSKLMVEDILRDLALAEPDWHLAILRYFNPIGAHSSGLIGEHPNGTPNNLMPYISQTAIGKHDHLKIFGNDYPTPDGTGVRDYLHVVDLAEGHLKALQTLQANPRLITVNLGTGKGYSVLEMVNAFEQATGQNIPYKIVPRRPGDIAECWADPSAAKTILGWQAQYDLHTMCADSWRWQTQNPNGYR